MCRKCVVDGLCVMFESKVCFFSKIGLFWAESFILTWIQEVMDSCLELFRKKRGLISRNVFKQ